MNRYLETLEKFTDLLRWNVVIEIYNMRLRRDREKDDFAPEPYTDDFDEVKESLVWASQERKYFVLGIILWASLIALVWTNDQFGTGIPFGFIVFISAAILVVIYLLRYLNHQKRLKWVLDLVYNLNLFLEAVRAETLDEWTAGRIQASCSINDFEFLVHKDLLHLHYVRTAVVKAPGSDVITKGLSDHIAKIAVASVRLGVVLLKGKYDPEDASRPFDATAALARPAPAQSTATPMA